ncbi:MAG TPA: DUF1800 domain-containing protein [Propionibacteriaceae bacterium]|nr:DUF1800 domain-containing protein [Propionibacteriaceae bacterium]
MSTDAWRRTARIMRRAAFGVRGADVDRVGGSVDSWVADALKDGPDAAADATPPPSFPTLPPLAPNASQDERQARNRALTDQGTTLVTWWVRRMLTTTRPVRERITFGWHNHWATSLMKVRQAPLMLQQNQLLRTRGFGSFTDLAQRMVLDPALLIWLDAEKNTKAAPNENLARELMELFTVGVDGGYSEDDVKQAARALTGWRVAPDGTVTNDPKRTDPGPETILGTTARFTPATLVDTLLAAPVHPRHLATRWWHQLASDDPVPEDALARLVAAYGPARDVTALLAAVLLDPAFAGAAGTLVASPVDWLVGSMRTLAVPVTDASVQEAVGVLRRLGQVPFLPPNVSGWPSGASWSSTAAASTRAAVATRLSTVGDVSAVADAPATSRTDAVAHLLALDGFSERTLAALALAKGDPKRLVATALISPDYLVV